MPDYIKGVEIMERAMRFLIDMDAGCFERLQMACKEVFSLQSDCLNEDAVNIYLEIDGMFDRSHEHETEGFCWQNLMEMPDDKKQMIAEKIFLLYSILSRAAEQQRISLGR